MSKTKSTASSGSASAVSFVSEVLATAGSLEKENITAKLSSFSKKTEEIKGEVYNALQKKHGDFYPDLMSAVDLNSRVDALSKDMESVATKVEKEIKVQLKASSAEYKDLSCHLEESKAIMSVLSRLVSIDEALQNCENALKNKDFQLAARSLNVIKTTLSQTSGPRDRELQILQALQKKYTILMKTLETDMAKEWSNTVKWNVKKEDVQEKKDQSSTMVTVTLNINEKDQKDEILTNLLQTMQDFNMLESKLQTFSDRFLENVVEAVLTYQGLQMKIEPEGVPHCLSMKGKKMSKSSGEVSVDKAIEFLSKAFLFLSSSLFSLKIRESSENVDSKTFCLMQKLGSLMQQKFIYDHMIVQCLKQSIPTTGKDLKAYTKVINSVEAFQKLLVGFEFLAEDNAHLFNFVNDVNVLFANKKCQEILEKARVLMTSEIHNMITVTTDADSEESFIGLEGTSAKKTKMSDGVLASEVNLSSNTFKLPVCCISESTKKVTQLAYETLYECTQGMETPECSIQLFYCVRNIFILFHNVVPEFHKESLESLPQITALHHNNCMFLAHCLLTLGHQFRPKLPHPLSQGAATFVDLVPQLRRLGTDSLRQQMEKQKQLIVDCLGGAQGFVGVSEGDNHVRAERAIKQCLFQIQRLSNVWKDVLPESMHNTCIGTLVDFAMVEITKKVTSLEDISAKDATQLHRLLSLVTSKAPDFYKGEDESEDNKANLHSLLHTNIDSWNKYSELLRILNSGLQDIADRWADGKGPLASEFSPNEVKQLIRAIFQNTDKRSAVLATIK